MGMDPRIGPKFLYPGVGYGGSCFPKDTRALINTAREHGMSMSLVAAAERINEAQKLVMVRKLRALVDDVAGKTFCMWGLAFKPNTDDVREAPALRIARSLLNDGAKLRLHDPEAGKSFMEALGNGGDRVTLHADEYAAAEGADALLLVTEWREYRSPDFDRLKKLLAQPILIDGRNQWDRGRLEGMGFRYAAIGR
jgi:UDPglucose 6-dehydrogenase